MWGLGLGGHWGILGLELSGICGGWVWEDTGGYLGLSWRVNVTGGNLGLSLRVYVGLGSLGGYLVRLGLELSDIGG